MKITFLFLILLAVLLSVGTIWLRAAPLVVTGVSTASPEVPPVSTTSATLPQITSTTANVEDEITTGVVFHVYFPSSLPPGYAISANPNVMHYEGGVLYSVNASGTPIVTVTERTTGDQAVQFVSLSEMIQGGSVTSSEIDSAAGHVAVITKGFTSGHQLSVVSFTRDEVDIQLSSFGTPAQVLVQLANAMQ